MTTQSLEKRKPAETSAVERTWNRRAVAPAVDIYEAGDGLTLVADMPGVNPNDINIQFERGELVLNSTSHSPAKEGRVLLLAEHEPADYFRTFQISEAIDSTKITAEYKDGVLKLHLPKVEAAKPRKISVAGK